MTGFLDGLYVKDIDKVYMLLEIRNSYYLSEVQFKILIMC